MNAKREKNVQRWLMIPYRLAHHPICPNFSEHVYSFKGYKLCRGCVNLYLGQFTALILSLIGIFVFKIGYWIPFILTFGLFMFTPLGIILELKRWIKDFFRFLLGNAVMFSYVAVIISFLSLFEDFSIGEIFVIIAIIITHILARIILIPLRKKSNKKICENCEQYNLPRCEGMKFIYDRKASLKSFQKGDAFSE